MTASQRREMVLRAALLEFAARGLGGTSTQDIAQRAGISQPYLFRLFPTKKALFLALVRRCFHQVAQVFAAAAADQVGEDALQAMGSAFGQLCRERTLPLMQLHTYATAMDLQAADNRWASRRLGVRRRGHQYSLVRAGGRPADPDVLRAVGGTGGNPPVPGTTRGA